MEKYFTIEDENEDMIDDAKKTDGYIYCLSNPLYEGIYKVGMTKNDPYTRMRQLYSTGVPLPFNLEFAKKVDNCYEQEQSLHKILSNDGKRINKKREFFKVSKEEIKSLFDKIDGEYFETNNNEIKKTNVKEHNKKYEKISLWSRISSCFAHIFMFVRYLCIF